MNLKQTLTALTALDAVTAHEHAAAQTVRDMLAPLVDDATVDQFGNVHGMLRCGKAEAKTVLLDAHLDQIGFLVCAHEAGGFVRLASVGGIDPRMMMGSEVTLLTNPPRTGIVACMPPHTLSASERGKSVPVHELLVDTGLAGTADAIKAQVPIGTAVVFTGALQSLGAKTVVGRSLDDRAGIAAILYALEKLQACKHTLAVDIAVLFSVQEEVTTLGATVGTYRVRPDYAIAVDVSHAKTPDAPDQFTGGGGVMIGMGPNMNRALWQALMRTCKLEEIDYQIEVMEGHTGTNAWEMQIAACGTATAILSIPLRYMHTPIESVQLSDIQATGDLMHHFLRNFDGEVRL